MLTLLVFIPRFLSTLAVLVVVVIVVVLLLHRPRVRLPSPPPPPPPRIIVRRILHEAPLLQLFERAPRDLRFCPIDPTVFQPLPPFLPPFPRDPHQLLHARPLLGVRPQTPPHGLEQHLGVPFPHVLVHAQALGAGQPLEGVGPEAVGRVVEVVAGLLEGHELEHGGTDTPDVSRRKQARVRAADALAAAEVPEAGKGGGAVEDSLENCRGGGVEVFLFLKRGEGGVSGRVCLFEKKKGRGWERAIPVPCNPACLRLCIVVGCWRRRVRWRLTGRNLQVWPLDRFLCRARPMCVVCRGILAVEKVSLEHYVCSRTWVVW